MLQIPRAFYDEIIVHCRSKYPKEACGILVGETNNSLVTGQDRRVTHVYPMTNVEDSPIGYSMDPREQLRLEKEMRLRNQRMVGIYHSHTASAAYPSSVDVGLAISPDLSYVLVSLKDRAYPELRSYTIDGQEITAESVRIEDAP